MGETPRSARGICAATGVADVGFVAPQDSEPVGAARLDAVFADEVPDDLFKGDAAGGEVEAGEGFPIADD